MFSEHYHFELVFYGLLNFVFRDVFELANENQMLLDCKKIIEHIKLLAKTHVLLDDLGLFANGVAVNKCVS